MFFLQRAIQSGASVGCYALSGALFGVAFLTRPIALPVCFLSFFPIWFHIGLQKALLRWGVLFMVFVAVLSPWFFRNVVALGNYTPLSTDGGYNLWYASIPDNESKWFGSPEFRSAVQRGYYLDREANNRFTKMAAIHIKSDPLDYLQRGLLRFVRTWSYFPGSQLFASNALVFGFFSLVQFAILVCDLGSLFRMNKSDIAYLLLPVVGLSCVLVLTKGISRFIVPAMPFVLILSVQGFWMLEQRLFKTLARRRSATPPHQ